eukprot:TRINITY_DN23286_c0_g1_i1.p1 TRINITY_DN23286_c0_g1~~TRINITY_DN23286_c0_g1_i1.p1  ORF type:complete len:433 (-),score=94.43 TRINITY_DN23286_c0_g1_i1:546-1844(-)
MEGGAGEGGDDGRTNAGSSTKRGNHQGGEGGDASTVESCVRFLVPGTVAGSVIGKGGATISEFQQQSGARIQLSRNKEFFPGTGDRIILLTGTVTSMLTALHLILTKVSEQEGPDAGPGGVKGQVRLLVPNTVAGAVIGKGGSTIRSFVEDSGANIKLSSQDQALPGVNERMVTISGTLEQQLRAVALVVSKLSEDPSYASFANVPLHYPMNAGYGGGGGGYGNSPGPYGPSGGYAPPSPSHYGGPMSGYGGGGGSSYGGRAPPSSYGGPQRGGGGPPLSGYQPQRGYSPGPGAGMASSITVAVPDEHVGAMVGKGGRTITEIQQVTGVHIKLSDRGDYVEGTNHRKVTITGTSDAVIAAQQMITRKVQDSMASQQAAGERGGGGYGGERGGGGRDGGDERGGGGGGRGEYDYDMDRRGGGGGDRDRERSRR